MVALGPDGAELTVQNGSQHFLGGGFAHAAGNSQDLGLHGLAVSGGNGAEGQQRVFYLNIGDVFRLLFLVGIEDRHSAVLHGAADEGVAVHPCPHQRNEHLAGLDLPGIGGNAPDLHFPVRLVEGATAPLGNLLEFRRFHIRRSFIGGSTPALSL